MIEIKSPQDCCGCTACASICPCNAIDMVPDKEGFLYPNVKASLCIDCKLCEKVCPIEFRKGKEMAPNQLSYKALRIKDKTLLGKSSSGGAFIAIASYIIKNEGGVVFGARYSGKAVVEHDFAETMDEVEKFMGSKYSQSDIRGIYAKVKEFLNAGRTVLFTGTPCQVHGLLLYLRKKYDNLITLDLICHAVPSPKIFRDYVEYCSKKLRTRITAIDMRYKQTSYRWGHKFAYRFHFENGEQSITPSKLRDWGVLYFSRLIDRPSCHECKYTNYNRCGDITISDFWDDDNKRPDIFSKEGTSLCLINTKKGEKILCEVENKVELWNLEKEESWQPCLSRPIPMNIKREQFWKYYNDRGFEKTYKKFFDIHIDTKIKNFIKKIIGKENARKLKFYFRPSH